MACYRDMLLDEHNMEAMYKDIKFSEIKGAKKRKKGYRRPEQVRKF